jgi:2OG-Fe(II) oxygenase superfamily
VQVPASPLEGAITVNIGDILMRWSDDTLKSTYHRVRVPEKVHSPFTCSSVVPTCFSFHPSVSAAYIALQM